jgi:LacI family transcriptional regulator
VSNALNRPGRVAAESLERVNRAIEELGYVRNEAARQLRDGRSRTIGFVLLDGKNPFFLDIARGAEERAALSGLSVTLGDSARDATRELAHLDLFEEQRVTGVLISPYGNVLDRLGALAKRNIGTVLLNRRSDDPRFSSVSADDESGGRLAVDHLIAAGRRRIAFVGSEETTQFAARLRGARQAARLTEGVTLEHIPISGTHVIGGRAAGEAIAQRPTSERPDGVFASNDIIAMGVMQGLTMGSPHLRIPDDVAVIGYDDIEFAETAVVPLTSVRHPAAMIGLTAVDILLKEIEDPDRERRHVVFHPEVVARASTA